MRHVRILAAALSLAMLAPAFAQDGGEVSAEETEKVNAAIAELNCGPAGEIEKETDDLFELDDVRCKAAQYDIKLDGAFNVISLTYDGPIDD